MGIFKKSTLLIMSLIIIFAFVLRFYKITEDPPALNWDEVSIGYNAYSILKTGKDEWGKFLPTHFKSYGEYKLPVQIYASIPAIAIFGLNDFAVRITPVIYGTLTILLMFLLGRKIFKTDLGGLFAAFFLAISPWHIHLTRASFESSMSVFWVVLGAYLFIKGLEGNPKWLIASVTAFAISIFTYNSARVFSPVYLAILFFVFRKQLFKVKKALFAAVITFLVLVLPLIPFVLSGEGSARYKLVSIINDPGLIPRINEHRGNSKLMQPLPRLVHNKLTYLSFYFIRNYITHFSPVFLFLSGAPHKQHHVQRVGEMYLFQFPLLILGLFYLYKDKNKYRWLIALWILIGVIPVATTNDSIPHALRTLIIAPAYQLICAYGTYKLFVFVRQKNQRIQMLVSLTTGLIILVALSLYLDNYYNNYPKLYSRDWQYGNKQAVEFIKQHQDEYDLIVYTRHFGEPHMFTLFYLGYDPKLFQDDPNLVRFETYDWVRVLKFDKFFFPDLGDAGTRFEDIRDQNSGKKILFIGRSGDFPQNQTRLETISFLNGDSAFDIVEVK